MVKAKLQLLAFISLDGYLLDKTVPSPLWNNPNKYGITKIRNRAMWTIGWNVSFISLTQWKKEGDDLPYRSNAGNNLRHRQHVQILASG